MSDIVVKPDRVFDAGRLRDDLAVVIDVSGRVGLRSVAPDEQVQRIEGTLAPGFVDLQVNGGGGVLLNTTPTAEGIARILAAHRSLGTIAMLPTVITDAPEILAAAVNAAIEYAGMPGMLGLHIEGPHIAPARRGTHAAEFVRPFEADTMNQVRRLREVGLTVMITVAPEAVGTHDIAALTAEGAVVSLGHSDADGGTARQAFAQGARAVTHLFNAMSPMTHRAPGLSGAAVNSDAYVGIIADGIHVADEMVGLAVRARPIPDRTFLVSDAMATVGGSDHFALYGQEIHLKDGRLQNAEGSLAGAHTTVAEGVARLAGPVGISEEAALRMGITVPAALIGHPELATLEGRSADDLIRLGDGLTLEAVGRASLELGSG